MPNDLNGTAPAQPRALELRRQIENCRRAPWKMGVSMITVIFIQIAGTAGAPSGRWVATIVGLASVLFLGYVWWKLFQTYRHLRRALEISLQEVLDQESRPGQG